MGVGDGRVGVGATGRCPRLGEPGPSREWFLGTGWKGPDSRRAPKAAARDGLAGDAAGEPEIRLSIEKAEKGFRAARGGWGEEGPR